MVTQLPPDRLALPPPLALDLIDDGRVVGWITRDRLGFGGFSTRVDAAHAAWLAHQTLTRRLARPDGTRPVAIDREPLALSKRDGREVLLAGGRPIADLVSPGAERVNDAHSFERPFGFEIQVPPPADEIRVRAMADLIYRTLRRSGLRWAVRAPATAAVAPNVAPAAPASPARVRAPRNAPVHEPSPLQAGRT